MAEGGELRPNPSIECSPLINAMNALTKCKLELEKVRSEFEAVHRTGQCTVMLGRQFAPDDFNKLYEEVKLLLRDIAPTVSAHAEEHPAGRTRDSGYVSSINGLESLADEKTGMPEKHFAGAYSLEDDQLLAMIPPRGETHC